MSIATKHICKVIGIGGEGAKVVKLLHAKDPNLCPYAICDTDQSSLDAFTVPGKVLLDEDDKRIPDNLIDGAELLILVSVLGGATGNVYSPIIAKKAKEKGINVWCVIAHAPDRADTEAACLSYWELLQDAEYIQMINTSLLSSCFLHRPKDKVLMGILGRLMANYTESLVRARIRLLTMGDKSRRAAG